ncbi:hypothetical protein EHS13_35685 [Paenibacillus psychroresistens]|uniref:Rad50/SbcC-type AAA domain-containing protein n=1 Tax=Paenibacillus psychroresistens TaxID=1778678 RepID=A0A6B8RTI9_9BACL|nr:hypothetical protein [Paenibacillus psychroresistens]QGQ99830.1 hypothetical protein EHS13_35685 [Paenibacillus psychroresistens]
MKTKLIINKLFAYSERTNKYFYAEFDDGVNIIYGKNTSGKSTVFQLILYTFGINDNNDYLKEIIEEGVFLRLDCQVICSQKKEGITFIREDETLFIKRGNYPVRRFNGIKGNNSAEHIKLKGYMHDLFGFSLKLENKDGYKPAPIEAMFLPYYIPQSVGWVYLRKSFSSFEYYRNLKEDYLDYYLGIESLVDRERKQELEKKLKNKEEEIKFYLNLEKNNDEFQITKLVDEEFIEESLEYIKSHSENQVKLNENEEEYISKCNEQSYFKERQSLLRKVSRHHKEQNPINGTCPACDQKLSFSIKASYKYLQEENDTEVEMKKCKEIIKKLQGEINSLGKNIDTNKQNILKAYQILKKHFNHNISYDSWLGNKVNVKLINDIIYKLGVLTTEKVDIENSLKEFKTEEEVEKSRSYKNKEFERIFLAYIDDLGIKTLIEERYTSLYKISAFPSQGVELHKTVLAYNFALNKLIESTQDIHRFPFMLDAIFKEDIEQHNKNAIVEFIGKYKLNDTQLILSIAETKEDEKNIHEYNKSYFNGNAKLICIGEGTRERAFLSLYDGSMEDYLEETLNIIN